MLAVSNTAWEEIQQTASLSEATYAKAAPLVRGQGQSAVKTPGTGRAKESNPAGAVERPGTEKAKQSNAAGTVKTPESEKAKQSNPAIDHDFIRRLEEQRFLLQTRYSANLPFFNTLQIYQPPSSPASGPCLSPRLSKDIGFKVMVSTT